MAEQNPELQAKLQELEHELEVGLFRKRVSDTDSWESCFTLSAL